MPPVVRHGIPLGFQSRGFQNRGFQNRGFQNRGFQSKPLPHSDYMR